MKELFCIYLWNVVQKCFRCDVVHTMNTIFIYDSYFEVVQVDNQTFLDLQNAFLQNIIGFFLCDFCKTFKYKNYSNFRSSKLMW